MRAWDRRSEAWAELAAGECGFGYRSSRFNQQDRGRFVIAAVRFRLRPGGAAALRYPELRRQFPDSAAAPSLAAVRTAVRGIRRGKAMLLKPGDPECHSAGSFFKNVVVAEAAAALAERLGAAPPQFAAGAGQVKIPAAGLIEQAGFHKGYRPEDSGVGLSRRHVLAIVNYGQGTAAEVAALAGQIQSAVAVQTGIALHPEPVWVGAPRPYQPRR